MRSSIDILKNLIDILDRAGKAQFGLGKPVTSQEWFKAIHEAKAVIRNINRGLEERQSRQSTGRN